MYYYYFSLLLCYWMHARDGILLNLAKNELYTMKNKNYVKYIQTLRFMLSYSIYDIAVRESKNKWKISDHVLLELYTQFYLSFMMHLSPNASELKVGQKNKQSFCVNIFYILLIHAIVFQQVSHFIARAIHIKLLSIKLLYKYSFHSFWRFAFCFSSVFIVFWHQHPAFKPYNVRRLWNNLSRETN